MHVLLICEPISSCQESVNLESPLISYSFIEVGDTCEEPDLLDIVSLQSSVVYLEDPYMREFQCRGRHLFGQFLRS